jgi:cobalt/nickel transport system permease protein
MHIPEGALSPQTYGAAYAVMAPLWVLAGRRVQRRLAARQVPLLAVCAAFCFVVMMINVPVPGLTMGHATGVPLVAILLGPWAAVLVVTVVLAVQAFLFLDGGVTALAANCLNMAVLMPFVSYWVFRTVSWRAPTASVRRAVAAGAAGYIGINVAALGTAVMLSLQPLLAHGPDGRALYFPYGLGTSIAAISGAHLLLFGFVEAGVTALAYSYLARTERTTLMKEGAGP